MVAEGELKKEYFIERQGKSFVLFAGLLDEAHERGLKSIRTALLQAPTEENGWTTIVQATVEMATGQVFQGIGDADRSNVGRNIAPHAIRMAETRSKARALRDAINVSAVALEEIGDVEDVEDTAPPPAPPRRQARSEPRQPPPGHEASRRPPPARPGVSATQRPPDASPRPLDRAAVLAAFDALVGEAGQLSRAFGVEIPVEILKVDDGVTAEKIAELGQQQQRRTIYALEKHAAAVAVTTPPVRPPDDASASIQREYKRALIAAIEARTGKAVAT